MRLRYLGGAIAPDNQPLSNANTATGVAAQYQGSFSRQDVAQAETRGLWIADPHPADQATVMNINSDNAANALQNNTFIDGAQNLPVTRVGSVTQGSFNPFAVPVNTWSNAFGSGTGYINAGTNAAFAFGTGDFTLEAWINMSVLPAAGGVAGNIICTHNWTGSLINFTFRVNATTGFLFFEALGGANTTGNRAVPVGRWVHVACVRISGVITFYIDGTNSGGGTVATNLTSTVPLTIGHSFNGGAFGAFTGHISNARIVKGTAVYTAAFIPPNAPLTAITNTSLLTCQNYRFVDNSVNAFALTPTGNATVSTLSPFYTPYSYKNNTFGASMLFNGTTSVLGLDGLILSNSSFTAEAFIYPTATITATKMIIGAWDGTLQLSWTLSVGNNNTLIFEATAGGSYVSPATMTSASNVISINNWNHVAVVRNVNVFTMYVNGVSVGTITNALTIFNAASQTKIGGNSNNQYFQGNISNVRVVVGTAVYTTTFVIPIQPLQAITNTQLLTCQGSTVDGSPINETISNTATTVSTLGPFTTYVNQSFRSWPAGSIYCDGTASYLNLNGSSTLAFGSNNFSIAMWVYFTEALGVANQILYDGRASGGTATLAPALYVAQTTSVLSYFTNNAVRITGTTVIRPGQWYYVDVSRVSGSTRMYLNGVQEGATYTDANVYINGASRPVIGAAGDTAGAGPLSGFIYGLQVRNGSASAGTFPSTYPDFSPNTQTNVKLYLSGVNAGIYDTVGFTDYQTLGNAQVSTNTVKYGSGSVFFDGTGDWLISTRTTNNANPLNLMLDQNDFTIEAWVNVSSLAAVRSIISKGAAATGWTVNISTAGKLQFAQTSTTYTGIGTIVINRWYHIAVVRSGTGANNLRLYLNGIIDFESAAAVTTNFNQTELVYVGADRAGTTPMLGYIADLRVTKYARYLNNFVPPQATLPKH
jgi:hypothetical protein